MERKDQIEQLAKAWEACGDGRYIDDEGLTFFVFGKRNPKGTGDYVASFRNKGTDEDDATPCLAILRDVKGKRTTINQDDRGWWCEGMDAESDCSAFSDVSRILATASALEEK